MKNTILLLIFRRSLSWISRRPWISMLMGSAINVIDFKNIICFVLQNKWNGLYCIQRMRKSFGPTQRNWEPDLERHYEIRRISKKTSGLSND
jgi:hypothetical protein